MTLTQGLTRDQAALDQALDDAMEEATQESAGNGGTDEDGDTGKTGDGAEAAALTTPRPHDRKEQR